MHGQLWVFRTRAFTARERFSTHAVLHTYAFASRGVANSLIVADRLLRLPGPGDNLNASVPRFLRSELSMTSHSSCHRAIPAEALPAPESTLAPARRLEDDHKPRTLVGLLTGLLLCAASSALVIWLVTLLF